MSVDQMYDGSEATVICNRLFDTWLSILGTSYVRNFMPRYKELPTPAHEASGQHDVSLNI